MMAADIRYVVTAIPGWIGSTWNIVHVDGENYHVDLGTLVKYSYDNPSTLDRDRSYRGSLYHRCDYGEATLDGGIRSIRIIVDWRPIAKGLRRYLMQTTLLERENGYITINLMVPPLASIRLK